MNKERLTAFSDGVVAVIITIMVLEMKAPEGASFAALLKVAPAFGSYVLSFVYVGIYWNNHHHMLQAARSINGSILWANLNLLFWLSLTPFCTAWMGENDFQSLPVALYGLVLMLTGTSYYILEQLLVAHHGKDSALGRAVGIDRKGIASSLLYVVSIPLAFVNSAISCAIFVMVALLWLIPDRRIERLQAGSSEER
jgi:uncharacterized membrane protein